MELFCQNLVDITLEACWGVKKSKWYHLILKVIISSSKSRFPLITFLDPHLLVGTGLIQLDKPLYSA